MVGENITLNLRSDLYTHLLKMHIGWHDDAKNSGGVLTAILANDIQKLNGMSTEAIATIVRAALGLIGGMIICLIFVWKLGLICILFLPFALAGAFLGAKLIKNEILNDKEEIEANSLASDAISNYRTVAAYGLDKMIAKDYSDLIVGPVNKNVCNAHLIGLSDGYSKLMANVSLIFYLVIGAVLMKDDDSITGFNIFICSFVFIFASQTAS